MRAFLSTLLGLLLIAAFVVYLALFTVNQNQQALVLDFGKPTKVIDKPGLNYLIPFVQTVSVFDKRLLELDTQPQEVIVADQKRMVVDSFARYRIVDPLLFFQSVGSETLAQGRLTSILESSVRRVLGSASFRDIVRDRREELMHEIATQVGTEVKSLGIEIVDVRLKRADVPAQNSEPIYARMRTERQREASEFRAEGESQSRRIKATADREVIVIKAEASRQAETVRGEGDAERNRIFAEAYNQDADFFGFYRSMQAYEQSLRSGDTRLLLSPDSDFFKYFNDPSGRAGPPK